MQCLSVLCLYYVRVCVCGGGGDGLGAAGVVEYL